LIKVAFISAIIYCVICWVLGGKSVKMAPEWDWVITVTKTDIRHLIIWTINFFLFEEE
jgi:hypothetical protein